MPSPAGPPRQWSHCMHRSAWRPQVRGNPFANTSVCPARLHHSRSPSVSGRRHTDDTLEGTVPFPMWPWLGVRDSA